MTHLGVGALGLVALRGADKPNRVYWLAALFQIGLQLLCRFTTPPKANINISHRIWDGLESLAVEVAAERLIARTQRNAAALDTGSAS